MHTELNRISNSWINDDDKDARWMMSKGSFFVFVLFCFLFLFYNDCTNDALMVSVMLQIQTYTFEHSNIRAAITRRA